MIHLPGGAMEGGKGGQLSSLSTLFGKKPSNSNYSHGSAKLKVFVCIAQTSTANEGQVRIQYKCLVPIYVFPEMKLCMPPYFQNRIIMFSLPISTLICLWENCTSRMGLSILLQLNMYVDRSWEYINRSKTHECGNRDWGRAIPRRGMHKWDFRCSEKYRYQLKKSMLCISTISSCLCLKPIFVRCGMHKIVPTPSFKPWIGQAIDDLEHISHLNSLNIKWFSLLERIITETLKYNVGECVIATAHELYSYIYWTNKGRIPDIVAVLWPN